MRHRDAELRDEIEAHLEMATADRVERGEDPRDAAAAGARRELGNVAQIQEVDPRRLGTPLARTPGAGRALRAPHLPPQSRASRWSRSSRSRSASAPTPRSSRWWTRVRLRPLPVADPQRSAEVRLVDMDGARGNFQTWNAAVTYPIWQAIAARQQAFSGVFAWGDDTFSALHRRRDAHRPGSVGRRRYVFDARTAAGRGPAAERGRRSARLHAARGPEPRVTGSAHTAAAPPSSGRR